MYKADWKKYFIVFIITAIMFIAASLISNSIKASKLSDLREIQNRISIDILSSETQFALLSESSCETADGSALSEELDNLGTKLAYAEEKIQPNGEDLSWLKKSYSLLEIKDFLLMKKVYAKCKNKPVSILYFYSNAGDCADCRREGMVLTRLREEYPQLRVYSFDYNLDLSALRTLISLYKIKKDLPALVINEKVYSGFQNVEDIEKILPVLKTLSKEKTATTTVKTK